MISRTGHIRKLGVGQRVRDGTQLHVACCFRPSQVIKRISHQREQRQAEYRYDTDVYSGEQRDEPDDIKHIQELYSSFFTDHCRQCLQSPGRVALHVLQVKEDHVSDTTRGT